jgi:hypothetical protein
MRLPLLNRLKSAWPRRLTWTQKLLGVLAVVVAVVIVSSPEFLALGLLGDTAFFDLLVLLLGLQFQMLGTQARCCLVSAFSRCRRWIMTPNLSYLLVVMAFALLGTVYSAIQKVLHRLSS